MLARGFSLTWVLELPQLRRLEQQSVESLRSGSHLDSVQEEALPQPTDRRDVRVARRQHCDGRQCIFTPIRVFISWLRLELGLG